MEKAVVSLGGSIVAPDEPDPDHLKALCACVEAWRKDLEVLLVVGGGRPARRAIALARGLGVDEEDLDRIGVAATRLNAQVLRAVLQAGGTPVVEGVPTSTDDALRRRGPGQVLVMGGTTPGHSTDFVAAELAVAWGADRLVNVTNVDGVYSADPAKDPQARRHDRLAFHELLKIIPDATWDQAGAAGVLDGPAAALVARHGMTTRVCHGADLENVDAAVRGRAFRGTEVAGAAVPEASA